jgi:hypothetical protein
MVDSRPLPQYADAPTNEQNGSTRVPDEAEGTIRLLLARHGAMEHTAQGRFSGRTGADPQLS